MNKLISFILLACVLAGCSAPRMQDGYQVGDLSGTAVDATVGVLTMQQRYCAESDPVARKLLLKVIRSAVPDYPEEGLCTDVLGEAEE